MFKTVRSLQLAALASLVAVASANAAAPDFTTLTAAVDFSTVITATLSILASLAGVYIIWKGGKMILRAIKGG
jgi:hypothetical protein